MWTFVTGRHVACVNSLVPYLEKEWCHRFKITNRRSYSWLMTPWMPSELYLQRKKACGKDWHSRWLLKITFIPSVPPFILFPESLNSRGFYIIIQNQLHPTMFNRGASSFDGVEKKAFRLRDFASETYSFLNGSASYRAHQGVNSLKNLWKTNFVERQP